MSNIKQSDVIGPAILKSPDEIKDNLLDIMAISQYGLKIVKSMDYLSASTTLERNNIIFNEEKYQLMLYSQGTVEKYCILQDSTGKPLPNG